MEKLLIIAFVLFLVSSFAVYTFAKLYKKYKTLYKQEHEKLLGIQEEYSKLVQAYEIKKKNKEKANEKTDSLHNGDVSADDILPKRKN
jgi:Skp family chaperone for outer membrane proteins